MIICVKVFVCMHFAAAPAYRWISFLEGAIRGSQGTGVVSNGWLDSGLRSILYMLKPSR